MKRGMVLLVCLLMAAGVMAQELSLEVIEPSQTGYYNTELIPFKARVTENLLPAENVKVLVYCNYQFMGELDRKSDGYFEKELQPPAYGCPGEFEVVAEKAKDGSSERVTESVEVELRKPLFEIEPLTPLQAYNFGEDFNLDFGLDYDLKPGQTIYGLITVNDQYNKLFHMQEKEFTIPFTAQETFLLGETPHFRIELDDGLGNKAIKEFELEQAGFWFWYLKQNIIPASIILAFLAYIAWIETKKAKLKKKRFKA